jgi:hypothetical protein
MTEDEIQRMDYVIMMGEDCSKPRSLHFHIATLRDGTFRSCSVVFHYSRWEELPLHGRSKNNCTAAPETRHKETKRKAHKTNDHFTVGRSILQNNRTTWIWRLNDILLSSMTKEVVN